MIQEDASGPAMGSQSVGPSGKGARCPAQQALSMHPAAPITASLTITSARRIARERLSDRTGLDRLRLAVYIACMRWRFLERIDTLVPGEEVTGIARFPAELELFEDHFPGWPVVPGVILLETLAQLSGKGIGYSVRLKRGDWPFPILSMIDGVKFRRFVRPDQEVALEARFDAIREESASVRVKARVEGRVVAQAKQVFVFNAVPLEDASDAERLERLEGAELARLWAGFDPTVWSG